VASPVPESPRVRFGPYELDRSAGRLLKEGIPLKLQPQPFRVLLLLTSRPGQVVTREEIQRHLWGDSTFVDFERGINFSINQIRAVLRDHADKPRFVETLPRLGYRFIGVLEPLNGTPARAVNGTHDSAVHVVLPIELLLPKLQSVCGGDAFACLRFGSWSVW
jgi:DNA-binding winged helix-turn-helix (wHTH) protein